MLIHMLLQVHAFTATEAVVSQQVAVSDKEGKSTWRRGDKTTLTDRAEHLYGN